MTDKRAYFKLDVGYLTNPKVAAVSLESPTAVILHIGCIAYAAQHLTDGIVPLALVLRLTGATKADADLLFKYELLIDRGSGEAEVHDYLEHQRSAAEVKGASAKAKAAADARWSTDPDAVSNAPSMPDAERDASESAMPREREERERREVTTRAPRGTRIPRDFAPDDEMRTWATENAPHVDATFATQEFTDYWVGVPGQKGVKLDWVSTWRNHMRKQEKWARERIGQTAPGSAPRAVNYDQWRTR